MPNFTARLQELVVDPVWWISTVLLGLILNMLSTYLYSVLKVFLLNRYVRRSTSKVIKNASHDAMISQLIADPKFLSEVKQRLKGAAFLFILFPLGISNYLLAWVEYDWHRAGNNPSVVAALVYLIQSIANFLIFLVYLRLYLRDKKILRTAQKLQNRDQGS